MKRPLCVMCYALVATLGAAILSSTLMASSALAQNPDDIIKRDEGTWKAELTVHSPEGDMTMTGVETNRLLGDWMVSDFEGEIMGMQFAGHSVYGYDEEKEKIVGTWIDNMPQPGIPRRMAIMEGEYDKEMDAVVSYLDSYNMQGEKVREKHVVEYDGDDSRTMTMYQQTGEEEWGVMMVIKYTRDSGTGNDGAKVDN